jgi:hypothetical protein
LPGAVGVPPIWPAGDIVNPGGNAPAAIDQVYGAVPPEAEMLAEYAVPTVPFSNCEVVMVTALETAIEQGSVAEAER